MRSWIAAGLAALLTVSFLAVGTAPAHAALGDPGELQLAKTVDGQDSPDYTVQPGSSFQYSLLVTCSDEHCIDAVVEDQLPPEFAGFTIDGVTTSPASTTPWDITGCSVGGAVTANCVVTAEAVVPLGDLGGVPQFGLDAGANFRVNITLTAPAGLQPSWPHNGVAVPNTADATADNTNDATATVNVTVNVETTTNVTPSKSWSPSSQLYNPGASASFTIGAQNTSNVPASTLVLQDPTVAPAGATDLDASNPFTFVDFVGLCAPQSLPQGADLVQVDVYTNAGGTWNWTAGAPAASPTLPAFTGDVGGLRLTYTSTTGETIAEQGTAAAQCVEVEQRATNRTTGASLVGGATVDNTVGATLTFLSRDPVQSSASAALTIGPLDVVVEPGKQITPDVIPAGADFAVALSARNGSNGPLTTLTIAEPAPGTDFLSDELTFDGFTSWTWPAGATGGTIVWHFDGAPDSAPAPIDSAGPPTPPTPGALDWITGFTVTYTGAIEQGTAAGIGYAVATDPGMIADVAPFYEDLENVIQVTGTNPAGTDTETADDDVRIHVPAIELDIVKTVSPSLVTPGGTVVAELETTTATNAGRVDPTQIVVEDVWDGTGATDFWDAFRPRELSFIQIPSGSTLTVRYTTDSPAIDPITWIDLVVGTSGTGGLYSNDLSALPSGTADDITGFQFVFDHPTGFGQGTIVKPNIVFQAASTLRSGGPTTTAPNTPVQYDNVATADGEGVSGGQTVEGDEVSDTEETGIVSFGGPGPGPGSLLADKRWVQGDWSTDLATIPSQSGQTARTLHSWGVTIPGYDRVTISDPSPSGETNPAGTVFQAFDLTGIRAVTFAQDPLLRWDRVTAVEIYAGGAWQAVPVPGGGWMNASGFVGYNPGGAELATLRSATGVRIVIEPDDAARAASTEPGRPGPGTGVASSATARPLWLQWQLRNSLRVPAAPPWATGQTSFNHADVGVVDNTFRVAGTVGPDTFARDEDDDIRLLDNPPGVDTAKTASPTSIVVPHPGAVPAANYPTVRFTVDAWNTVQNRASYLRVTDPIPCTNVNDCVTPASDQDPDVFTGNTYDAASNPFERFTITDVGFVIPGAVPIDQTATQVAVWRYDEGTGSTTVDTMTMAALAAADASALADVVGISIVYQSTDPGTTGGLIPVGSATSNNLRMVIDTQLRPTLRSTGANNGTGGIVENDTLAQSYDPVLGAARTPNASGIAPVNLTRAALGATATKGVTPATIVETNPTQPVQVTLGATSGTATAAPTTVTISDTTAAFWDEFELVSLGAVTRPGGADLVRVDVRLDGDPTWVEGEAAATAALPISVTDLSLVTGIRYVFLNDPTRPFSITVPSAAWTASAVFTVQLRPGATFPSAAPIPNTVNVLAEHAGMDPAGDSDDAEITLSRGTPVIAVQKEAVTGGANIVDPGVSYPWTLRFTNIGDAYIGINELVDDLGDHLRWDGSQPLYETDAAAMTDDPAEIEVSQSAADEITFVFPPGSVLAPGEYYLITVSLVLLPGLTPAQNAVNGFWVDTDSAFAAGDCRNVSGNNQGVLAGLPDNQCGTTNFVRPQSGALLLAEKEVRGEIDGALTNGVTNINNPSLPCSPASGGFYRSVCVPDTVIGATDEWRIGAVNTGTIAYSRLVLVDALPTPGDRLLATGGARGSAWRPVLDTAFGIQPTTVGGLPAEGVPAGTTVSYEVTTDAAPCVGTGPTAWPGDPECGGNAWVALGAYAGAPADVTGIRVVLDFTTTPAGTLPPGASVHFLFRTINTPWEAGDVPTAQAVHPRLDTGPTPRAWNQVGVVATRADTGATMRQAPVRVGVQLLVGSAAIAKTVSGVIERAPAQVTVDVACTVPGGAAGRAPVDLGAFALLPVPTGGTARLDGIPLGAQCTFAESGDLGDFGEIERTPSGSQIVEILEAGAPGDVVPVLQTLSVDNRYAALGALGSSGVETGATLWMLLLGLGTLVSGVVLTLVVRRRRATG